MAKTKNETATDLTQLNIGYAKQAIQQGAAFFEKLRAVDSFSELIELQVEQLAEAREAYTAHAARVREIQSSDQNDHPLKDQKRGSPEPIREKRKPRPRRAVSNALYDSYISRSSK